MASQISQAIKAICEEKLLSEDAVLEAVEAALAAAYRKDFGNKNQNIKCEFEPEKYDGETAGIRIFDVKQVVADMDLPDDYFERFEAAHSGKRDQNALGEKYAATTSLPKGTNDAVGRVGEISEEEFVFNPKTMIMLSDARDLKPDAQINDEIRVELNIPAAFGRMAAQTAKQVIMQKLREAERNVIFHDFKEREGELMNVTVQRREGRVVLIDLGRATGIILPEDQIENERYFAGARIKAILREVVLGNKGPEIRLSRSSPGLVAALCAQEIPEIANGVVEIKDIAREAGSRTKVAVATNDDMIDPIGSCIGQRGTRIQTIIRELGGEKVDIVLWSDQDAQYISNALSPAKVMSVELKEQEHLAIVTVTPDQLSLAIGKGGQNVRLAAKLTGWKITVINTAGGEVVADSTKEGIVEPSALASETPSIEAKKSPEIVEPQAAEEVVKTPVKEVFSEAPIKEEVVETPVIEDKSEEKASGKSKQLSVEEAKEQVDE